MYAVEKKFEIEMKLRKEIMNIQELKSAANRSTTLANDVCNVLGACEQRLQQLETAVLPLYGDTARLQLVHQNMERTAKALDHVINYYMVSRELADLIQAGPHTTTTETLNIYLEALDKLADAQTYFNKNNPQSVELENINQLYNTGVSKLESAFEELLNRNTRPLSPTAIMDMIALEEDSSVESVSVGGSSSSCSVQGEALRAAAGWLSAAGRAPVAALMAARAPAAKAALAAFRDYLRESSVAASPLMRAKNLLNRSDSTSQRRTSKIQKVRRRVRQRGPGRVGGGGGGQRGQRRGAPGPRGATRAARPRAAGRAARPAQRRAGRLLRAAGCRRRARVRPQPARGAPLRRGRGGVLGAVLPPAAPAAGPGAGARTGVAGALPRHPAHLSNERGPRAGGVGGAHTGGGRERRSGRHGAPAGPGRAGPLPGARAVHARDRAGAAGRARVPARREPAARRARPQRRRAGRLHEESFSAVELRPPQQERAVLGRAEGDLLTQQHALLAAGLAAHRAAGDPVPGGAGLRGQLPGYAAGAQERLPAELEQVAVLRAAGRAPPRQTQGQGPANAQRQIFVFQPRVGGVHAAAARVQRARRRAAGGPEARQQAGAAAALHGLLRRRRRAALLQEPRQVRQVHAAADRHPAGRVLR
uniref:Exocyst complex component 7 n=1 Tax=Bombyx mori TaxID=7091 RepID=A0A8R2QWJ0_BOMMO|nr:uncharacterized protein LOC101741487 isoform X4 [Bombyx mori]